MESIIIHPKSKEEISLFEQLAKALKVPFEKRKAEHLYNPDFVDKILQGDNDLKAGKGRTVTLEELDGLGK